MICFAILGAAAAVRVGGARRAVGALARAASQTMIQSGADFEYVVPDSSLLIETPCAVTKDAPQAAKDFLDFTESAEGQKLYAETGFRPLVDVGDIEVKGANDPSNPFPDPATLQTMADTFGGWGEANDKYFGDGTEGKPLGIITSIINDSGKTSS